MYAEAPEPAIMPASLSCERDDNQKGLPRRPSVPRANGPAVEASAPRPAPRAMTQPCPAGWRR